MLRGLVGKDPAGLIMFLLLLVAFLPAAVIGLALHKQIKEHLFKPWPVIAALAAGGVLMIVIERWRKGRTNRETPSLGGGGVQESSLDAAPIPKDSKPDTRTTIESMTFKMALIIGLAQCLAMWAGHVALDGHHPGSYPRGHGH